MIFVGQAAPIALIMTYTSKQKPGGGRGKHPNCRKGMKNLIPRKKGEPVVNLGPRGRQYVGVMVNHLLHIRSNGRPQYELKDLEKIVTDPRESPAKILAARRILSASRDNQRFIKDKHGNIYPAGSDTEPGRDFERIADRIDGKPTIRVEHDHGTERTPEEIRKQLAVLIEDNPQLQAIMKMRVGAGLIDEEPEVLPEAIEGYVEVSSDGENCEIE